MKLALISQSFEEYKGGAEKFSSNLARYLIKKGLNIKLFARKISSPDLKPYGTEIKIFKKPPFLRILILAYTGLYLAKKWGADRIFALMPLPEGDFYWLAGGVYKNWLKIRYPNLLKRNIASVLRPHLLLNHIFQKKIITSPNLKKIITNSEFEKENILKFFDIFPGKIVVIPNGVNLSRFNIEIKENKDKLREMLGFKNDSKILLFSGNNFKRKGLETIIKALARLKDFYDVYLLVAGKDKPHYFLKLSRKLGILERIRFLGYVKDIEKIYGIADVFVFPSQYDSFANVVLEAMACGLPVITTKTNGASMVITHEEDGFILNRWDDEELLAEYIAKTLENFEEMGFKAYQKALNYSEEKCFENYYQVLINN